MKQLLYIFLSYHVFINLAFSQETVYPAKEYKGRAFITNGTVHVGNGTVIEHATIEINNGKIVQVGTQITPAANAKVYDASGKEVYPGLILPSSDLGLKEIGSGVRGSNDYREIGDFNPSIRAISAYNTDSKVINTLKGNGILLTGIAPSGGTINGLSSVVQLDAWHWEDAAYVTDNGVYIAIPSFVDRFNRRLAFFFPELAASLRTGNPKQKAIEKVEEVKKFFRESQAYFQQSTHKETNIKFEAVRGLFNHTQRLFVRADEVQQMMLAIDFVKEFNFLVTIVGGSESYLIADLLKQNNISVLLSQEHRLPETEDDDIDMPFKTPALLKQAGVLFAFNDEDENTRYRNLMFNAGTAATYGLTKEEALQAMTLNAAKILGIDSIAGSIEAGKDANIIISAGDILDMKNSNVVVALIQGREVSLENKQTQLYKRYLYKYNLQ